MAAHIGVATTYDLTTPTGGYTHEATKDQDAEVATVRNESGVTVIAVAKKMVTVTQVIKGKGDPDFASVVAAASVAVDTLVIESAKGTETADDFPDFEITGKIFTNVA